VAEFSREGGEDEIHILYGLSTAKNNNLFTCNPRLIITFFVGLGVNFAYVYKLLLLKYL
jgi:hypothetical protein